MITIQDNQVLELAEMRGELQAEKKKAATVSTQNPNTSQSGLEAMREELDTAKQQLEQKDSVRRFSPFLSEDNKVNERFCPFLLAEDPASGTNSSRGMPGANILAGQLE
eukprot:gb/GECG01006199.1/.p1 GENE.gb/GECG01006199.1/~~gb/GECG01006199.1/.p1  ORF type:complete len:109 (+),score=20.23 gb/GECG01006199.1/:1-327(+)